jgi:hypothetical protein
VLAKTLVLHIGANKTGSTAIQEFLRLNAAPLSRVGLIVASADLLPDSPVSGQQAPFVESLLADISTGAKIVEERIDGLMQGLPKGGRAILSAENLSNPGNRSPQLFARTAQSHDTRVVLYIRRPDEFLLSSWRQWYSKTSDDFWAWIISAAGRRCNWRTVLEGWEKVVPRDRITVRIYDRARLHKSDVISDLLQVLGIVEEQHDFQRPEGNINPSYSEAVMDFVKGNPLLFHDMHDDHMYRVIDQLTGERFHRDPRESEITFEQRVALLKKYDDANNWVKNHYFRVLEGPLFTPPRPDDYRTAEPEQVLAEKWELVGALLYGLAKRVL